VHEAVQKLAELRSLPIHVKDNVFELGRITAICREYVARKEIGLAIVDYAQLVKISELKNEREAEVAEVSRTLRLLASELSLPIIVLSQLTKGETRWSRGLEHDATACWEIKRGNDEDEAVNIRQINIPWQRNGQSGIGFRVTFLGHISRVENYARSST
jgi:replicative DNA helicase